METKYGHIKTTTYRTNYSGENDDNFLQGKIREEESDCVFSEKKKKVYALLPHVMILMII